MLIPLTAKKKKKHSWNLHSAVIKISILRVIRAVNSSVWPYWEQKYWEPFFPVRLPDHTDGSSLVYRKSGGFWLLCIMWDHCYDHFLRVVSIIHLSLMYISWTIFKHSLRGKEYKMEAYLLICCLMPLSTDFPSLSYLSHRLMTPAPLLPPPP